MSKDIVARSARLAAMEPGAGRVKAEKPVYRAPRRETVALPNGKVRTVLKDGCVRSRLHQLIDANANYKDGTNKPTSYQTQETLREGLGRLFSVLLEVYPLEDPANIDGRHLQYLFDWMEQRWRNGQAGIKPSLSSATIEQYVSHLRHLCRWIGQPELIKRAGVAFEAKGVSSRTLAAKVDKSWEGQGIDIGAKIDQAWAIEPWVGVALLCEHALGLRRKEAVCLKPARDWDPAIGVLHVSEGSKGGRKRDITLWEPWQYDCLAAVQEWLREERRPNSHVGGTDRSLVQNIRRYCYVLKTIGITGAASGVTGHGLRAGFACRLLGSLGVTAPIRGGDVAALPPDVMKRAYTITTESMGHSRFSVVGAYAGAIGRPVPPQLPPPCVAPDMDAVLGRVRERLAAKRQLDQALAKLARNGGRAPGRQTQTSPEQPRPQTLAPQTSTSEPSTERTDA